MDDAFARSAAFLAAVLPPFLIVSYFLVGARVRFDTEMVWAAFGFGACAAFPAIVIAKLHEILVGYGDTFYAVTFGQAFLGAAVPEEICKLAALLVLCWRQVRKLRPNHLFALSVAVAGGFACLENIFYVVEDATWHATAVIRSVSAVPGHAFVGAVVGMCIVRAVRGRFGVLWWVLALVMPVALHGIYDFFLMGLANMEGQRADAPYHLAQTFVFLFILAVFAEGVMAHMSLRAIARLSAVDTRENGAEPPHDPISTVPAMHRLQGTVEQPVWWTALGILCLLGAGGFFLQGSIGPESGISLSTDVQRSLDQGFSAFAALHGAAFLGLSVVLRRRFRSRNAGRVP